MSIDNLRWWSHLLFWASVVLPSIGIGAGVGRYYVDRLERSLTAQATQRQSEASRRELEELRVKTEPRGLSEDQRRKLAITLSGVDVSPVLVASHAFDAESIGFGEQIVSALTEAGWEASQNNSSLNDFRGISISYVTALGQQVPGYHELKLALQGVGIDVQTREIPPRSISGARREGTILIVVGRR